MSAAVFRQRPAPPLRVGFVPVIRPVFKGDAPGAARESLRALEELGTRHGLEIHTASVGSEAVHQATGGRMPPFAVADVADAERAASELAAAELDFLLVQHTSFATGELLAPLLRAHRRVGLWALPESAGGRGARGPLPLNALCGLNMTLSLLGAPEVGRETFTPWFYGAADDPWFLERFLPAMAALRGLRALDRARILHIGGTAPGFFRLRELPDALPGVHVETRPLAELFEAVREVPENEATARAADWRRERHDVSDEQLVRGARIELALARLAEDAAADALAVRCWPELPDACGAMACAAMGNASGGSVPAACEGDVMGALSMLVLQATTSDAAILMDISDLDRDDDTLLVWHCGNAPLRWAADDHPARLTTHFNRDGVGVVRDMFLRPGPVTGFRLLVGGRRTWVVSGDVGRPDKDAFDGVRGWVGNLRWYGREVTAQRFVTGLLDHRLPHHLAFAMGDASDALRHLESWIGAEPVVLSGDAS